MFAGAEDSPHELPRVMSKLEQEANYLSLVTLPCETEKLKKIKIEETRLRARIQGRTILDPEFGLPASPAMLAELRP